MLISSENDLSPKNQTQLKIIIFKTLIFRKSYYKQAFLPNDIPIDYNSILASVGKLPQFPFNSVFIFSTAYATKT